MKTWEPRPYCIQPRVEGEGCETCSLVNYGFDCFSAPIDSPPKTRASHLCPICGTPAPDVCR